MLFQDAASGFHPGMYLIPILPKLVVLLPAFSREAFPSVLAGAR
tara:strand:- start:173 stop:304 length:132 start_codon:yes stop_codon:yes gene_type:complete